jgi:hypothetical protein
VDQNGERDGEHRNRQPGREAVVAPSEEIAAQSTDRDERDGGQDRQVHSQWNAEWRVDGPPEERGHGGSEHGRDEQPAREVAFDDPPRVTQCPIDPGEAHTSVPPSP